MKIIDSDNYKAAGIETMFFPGGEPHCKIPVIDEDVLLFLKLRTWNDVGIAACVMNALDRRLQAKAHAFIPYFPGARQDRVTEEDVGKYPLTLEIMSTLLAGWYQSTVVFDPHSKVIHEMGDMIQMSFTDIAVPIKDDVVGIIAPDQGATGRAWAFRAHFYPNAKLVQFYKQRDAASGYLVLDKDRLPTNIRTGRHIIVDDICDGGMTFNLLAEQFCEMSPNSPLELFVSHGIFSKGLGAIDKRIEHITTTNSWCRLMTATPLHDVDGNVIDILNERLTVLPLEQLFPTIQGYFQ